MAMTATFYHFSKRNRSTKVPDGAGTTLNIDLKDSTSVVHPIIIVQTIEAELFNYCFLSNFNRYYFISDWVYIKGRWECSLTLDPLATYKAAILSTSCNILYAAGATNDIADSRIPVESNIRIAEETPGSDGIYDPNGPSLMFTPGGTGMIILGITGKGSFGPYILQFTQDIKELIDGVDTWFNGNIPDTWTAIKQLFFGGSAAENLKSAFGLPIFAANDNFTTASAAEPLYLGAYPCKDANGNDIKGFPIDKPVAKFNTYVQIPWPANTPDWLRISTYTNLSLYVPTFGTFDIPATEAQYDTSLALTYAVNATSGDVALQVKGGQSQRIFVNASTNIAMATAYGSTGINTNTLLTSGISGVGAVAGGIAAAAAATTTAPALAAAAVIGGGLATVAGGTLSSMGGQSNGSPGLGGGASHALDQRVRLRLTQKILTDTQPHFDAIMGKPFMGVSTPGAFSGYVQTDGFQFSNDFATSTEKDTINKLMDAGVYIE